MYAEHRRLPHGRIVAGALMLLALGWLPVPAAADSLTIRVDPPGVEKRAQDNSRWDIYLEGEIEAGAAERVRQELAQIGSDGADVHLDSPGGSLVDGIRIGRLLRSIAATTNVGVQGRGRCFSACALAFLGGVYRYVPEGSLYGVHRVATATHSDRDFDAGQIVAAQVAGYIRDMGVDSRLFERMASVGRDQIYVLDAAELRALHVINDGRLPAEWWSDMSAQGPAIAASQQTAEGTSQAEFTCNGGEVVFSSIYPAGDEAEPIAAGQWVHSLVIDGAALPLPAPTSIDGAGGKLNASFNLSADEARRLERASSIGHTMRGNRSAAAARGYTIDVDSGAARRLRQFIESCLAAR